MYKKKLFKRLPNGMSSHIILAINRVEQQRLEVKNLDVVQVIINKLFDRQDKTRVSC